MGDDEASLADDARPTRTTGWALEPFDGSYVLYDPRSERIVEFNQTAALIWQLCDGSHTIAEIIALLVEAYPDDAARVTADVRSALRSLASAGSLVAR